MRGLANKSLIQVLQYLNNDMLGSIGMDYIISESYYRRTIQWLVQRGFPGGSLEPLSQLPVFKYPMKKNNLVQIISFSWDI